MSFALFASQRSPDLKMKVGACLVMEDQNICTGYNGSPYGSEWPENDEDKHSHVVHAELNAILHASGSKKNATMYTTLYPCWQCAKAIAQVGIKRVIYLQVKDGPNYQIEVSKRILKNKNVEVVPFHEICKQEKFNFDFESISSMEKFMINFISWDYNKKEKLNK
jgi:dCMP deaminase